VATELQNPRLAALIIADDAVGTPLVLGRSLTELQIARVVSTGARHVVCLVRQVSTQILAVADNLRANGLTIDIVRTVADAADAIHPDERLFLVASQVLVSGKTLENLLASGAPSLLCVASEAGTAQFEIVDASMRWAGYALLNGATLRRVANMVGDWDVASTLLRQLVQENSHRVLLGHDQIAAALLPIRDNADALQAGRKLLNEDGGEHNGLGNHWLGRPISRFLARLAGELGLKSKSIEIGATGTALVAAFLGLTGWLGIGLFLLLCAFFARGAAVRLATALGEIDARPLLRAMIKTASVVVVSACAVTLASRTAQWGCLLLGGLLIGGQILVDHRRTLASRARRWLSDPLSGVAILALGIVSTVPVTGLLVASAHAIASYVWLQRPSANVVVDQA
jgi:hypothetical protein